MPLCMAHDMMSNILLCYRTFEMKTHDTCPVYSKVNNHVYSKCGEHIVLLGDSFCIAIYTEASLTVRYTHDEASWNSSAIFIAVEFKDTCSILHKIATTIPLGLALLDGGRFSSTPDGIKTSTLLEPTAAPVCPTM